MTCFVWRKDRDLVSTAAFGHIADRIRPRESSFHTWDRPTQTPFFYDTGLSPVGVHVLVTSPATQCTATVRIAWHGGDDDPRPPMAVTFIVFKAFPFR